MGGFFNTRNFSLTTLIALFLWSSGLNTCHAREVKSWGLNKDSPSTGCLLAKQEITGSYDGSRHGRRTLSEFMGYNDVWPGPGKQGESYGSVTFDVLDYGAKGDGRTDDTKAFESAWAAACKVEAATLMVPSGSVFLVRPITFLGSACAENIIFQLDGTIIAPTSPAPWGSGLLQWIDFSDVKGITIRGKGTIDGRGSVWWNDLPSYNQASESELSSELSSKMPGTKPTALRFYGSTGVTVTGITIQNSPQTHLKFDSCTTVQVSDFTASSPENSPNTDGIHLQNSQNVLIYSSDLACGDDCISIQTGCSNVFIHDVNCGPGHGISIGGLGKDNTKACISNITVRDVSLHSTLAGVRIKTWQGGSGLVQGVKFLNIQVYEVHVPIVIDQFYCDGSKCRNESSAVAVSGIDYTNIRGTYTSVPVHFACSDNMPCSGISLSTIELNPTGSPGQPFCWNTYGELRTTSVPPINCLQAGKSIKPAHGC